MYNVKLHTLCLLPYLTTTFAAPTTDASALTLISPNGNFTNNNFSTPKVLLPNLPLSETILLPIPDSTITLGLNPRPNQPIPPNDLSTCLYATSTRVLDYLLQHGDGPLARTDDPFKSDPFPDINCKFAVRSWHTRTPQGGFTYLRYSIVYTVLRGLLEYMLFPDPHYYSISFLVRDDEKGTVGVGSIGTVHR